MVNLHRDQVQYSTQPAGTIPLRLAQVRAAIFFTYLNPQYLHNSNLRTAAATSDGKALTCVLLSEGKSVLTGGRQWDEVEYCVDPNPGLLVSYSAVPGIYVLYDYTKTLRFEDRTVPRKITVSEAGNTVVEAHLQSLTPARPPEAQMFTPASGMNVIGSGALLSPPWRLSRFVPQGAVTAASTIQPVIVHAMLSPQGRITDAEVLETANSGLNESALDLVKN